MNEIHRPIQLINYIIHSFMSFVYDYKLHQMIKEN